MSWEEPFRQGWPDPIDDLRGRFGLLTPSFSPREVAVVTALFVLIMLGVVVVLELSV